MDNLSLTGVIQVMVLGIVSYFLKKVLNTVDKLSDEVQLLKTNVAIILDRDRRKRVSDYREDEHKEE